MSKNKNKGSKKNKGARDLLASATARLQQFRRLAKQAQKLSTPQKVMGGLGLLVAGYAFLTRRTPVKSPTQAPASGEPAPDTAPAPGAQARVPKPRRTKPAGTVKHPPFSEERP